MGGTGHGRSSVATQLVAMERGETNTFCRQLALHVLVGRRNEVAWLFPAHGCQKGLQWQFVRLPGTTVCFPVTSVLEARSRRDSAFRLLRNGSCQPPSTSLHNLHRHRENRQRSPGKRKK